MEQNAKEALKNAGFDVANFNLPAMQLDGDKKLYMDMHKISGERGDYVILHAVTADLHREMDKGVFSMRTFLLKDEGNLVVGRPIDMHDFFEPNGLEKVHSRQDIEAFYKESINGALNTTTLQNESTRYYSKQVIDQLDQLGFPDHLVKYPLPVSEEVTVLQNRSYTKDREYENDFLIGLTKSNDVHTGIAQISGYVHAADRDLPHERIASKTWSGKELDPEINTRSKFCLSFLEDVKISEAISKFPALFNTMSETGLSQERKMKM